MPTTKPAASLQEAAGFSLWEAVYYSTMILIVDCPFCAIIRAR